MTNVLFCSIAFPPKNDPECIQTGKYFHYLKQENSLNLEVVTSKSPTLFMPVDPALQPYAEGGYPKSEIRIWENKYSNFLLRKLLKEGIDYPDSKLSFHWQWKKAARSLKQVPDVIYSRSNPISSTLMAYKLQKYFKVPWIMHLSDPWADSPLHSYTEKQYAYQKGIEKECMKAATKVCLTSEQTVNFYRELYPEYEDKFVYFPNVYDAKDITNDQPFGWGDKLRIVYTGGLSNDRSAVYFIRALEELVKYKPLLAEQLEVIFAGPLDRKNKAVFVNNDLPFIHHIGQLSFEEARQLQRKAHVLLAIDNPLKESRKAMFFPSKLLDYMTAKRRIWSITTPGSATASVMEKIKGDVFAHHEIHDIGQEIERAIEAYKNKRVDYFKVNDIPADFAAENNASRLVDLIKSIV